MGSVHSAVWGVYHGTSQSSERTRKWGEHCFCRDLVQIYHLHFSSMPGSALHSHTLEWIKLFEACELREQQRANVPMCQQDKACWKKMVSDKKLTCCHFSSPAHPQCLLDACCAHIHVSCANEKLLHRYKIATKTLV